MQNIHMALYILYFEYTPTYTRLQRPLTNKIGKNIGKHTRVKDKKNCLDIVKYALFMLDLPVGNADW